MPVNYPGTTSRDVTVTSVSFGFVYAIIKGDGLN